MKIQKTTLKIIAIGAIFMFFGYDSAYLISMGDSGLTGFWGVYDGGVSVVTRVSAEDDEDENEHENENEEDENKYEDNRERGDDERGKSAPEVVSDPIPVSNPAPEPVTPVSVPVKEPVRSTISTKKSVNRTSRTAAIQKPETTSMIIQDVGDSTRSINGISGASVAWESSNDKKALSTVKYYALGKKLNPDFHKSIETRVVTKIPTRISIPSQTSNPASKLKLTSVRVIPVKPITKPTTPVSSPISRSIPISTPDPVPQSVVIQTPDPVPQPTPVPQPIVAPIPAPNTVTKPS